MKKQLNYKGYNGSIKYSKEDNIYFGKVINITNLVNYEGASVKELEENFKNAVNDYLEMVK
ncbi:hypothetical protein [Tenacibaculum maritimum]|uniref:hypothetical protein n=1 Tax=Tenacibaculum maritimum TaxID=107401 RepID=UPI0010A56287|nr:hypothetical protein [Tenacibaculum maritimum]QCD62845.1 hypothetical protein B9C57_10050 [Tenacibaculum maritimum]